MPSWDCLLLFSALECHSLSVVCSPRAQDLTHLLGWFATWFCWSLFSRGFLGLKGCAAAEDLAVSSLLVPVFCFTVSDSGWLVSVLGAQWALPHTGSPVFQLALGCFLVLLEDLDI